MLFAQVAEDEEHEGPAADEEDEDEEHDAPRGRVRRVPEVAPVAPVRRRQPVVLEHDGDEEPDDDFAAEEGDVEGWDLAWGLTVIAGETEEQDQADGPEQACDGRGDGCGGGTGGQEYTGRPAGIGRGCQCAAPVPQGRHVELLATLDDASAESPALGRGAAFGAEVEGEEEGAAGRGCGVACRRDVVDPASGCQV